MFASILQSKVPKGPTSVSPPLAWVHPPTTKQKPIGVALIPEQTQSQEIDENRLKRCIKPTITVNQGHPFGVGSGVQISKLAEVVN